MAADGAVVKIEPHLNLLNGVTVIVGSMIGSAIFISPTAVVRYTGSYNAALIVWVTSGIYSAIGAYCFVELGCMIRKSGADYIYVLATFGPFWAFFRIWTEIAIVRPAETAIISLVFGLYSAKPFFPDCDPPDHVVRLNALCGLILLTFINCFSIRLSAKVQDIFTIAKVCALLLLVIGGIYQLAHGKTEYFTFEGTVSDYAPWALAYYAGLFAYNSWNYLNFLVDEMKNPIRDLPIALLISMILVTAVYSLVNISFYTTLDKEQLLSSVCVAVTFAQELVKEARYVIPIFVSLSTFGAINGKFMTSSRIFYVTAAHGHMPQFFAMILLKGQHCPLPSVLAVFFFTCIYLILPSQYIFELISYVGFATWFGIGLTVLCVPWLRWKYPDVERPIKVNLIFPIVYLIATVFICVVPMYSNPIETGLGLIVILSAIPLYFLFIWWKNQPPWFHNAILKTTKCLQKLFVVVTPDEM